MSDILRPAGSQPAENAADDQGTTQADVAPDQSMHSSGPGPVGPIDGDERQAAASDAEMDSEPADVEGHRDAADTQLGHDTADMRPGRDTADTQPGGDVADTEARRDTAGAGDAQPATDMPAAEEALPAADTQAVDELPAGDTRGAGDTAVGDTPAGYTPAPGDTLAATDTHPADADATHAPAADAQAAHVPATDAQPATDTLVASDARGDMTQVAGKHRQPADSIEDMPLVADTEQFHQRWQEIQTSFVDDPHGSVNRAASLAEEVANALISATQERMRDLRNAWDGNGADTEQLRATLRSYRVLINRLSGV